MDPSTYTRTYARKHARTHAHTHTRTHARTHARAGAGAGTRRNAGTREHKHAQFACERKLYLLKKVRIVSVIKTPSKHQSTISHPPAGTRKKAILYGVIRQATTINSATRRSQAPFSVEFGSKVPLQIHLHACIHACIHIHPKYIYPSKLHTHMHAYHEMYLLHESSSCAVALCGNAHEAVGHRETQQQPQHVHPARW